MKVDNKVVGRIGLGPLRNRGGIDTEIGYAIEESYSHQGIMGKAVGTTLTFLRHLRRAENNSYNFKRLRATAKLDNKASNRLLSSHGFVQSKSAIRDTRGAFYEYFYYF